MMKRRTFLTLGGAAGLTAAGLWKRNEITRAVLTNNHNSGIHLSTAPLTETGTECRLTPDQTDGPYYIKSPMRSDIREDRKGEALTLDFQIVSADGCGPVSDAVVEIWHCDAAGRYSGYPEDLTRRPFDTIIRTLPTGGPNNHVPKSNDKTYLRGAQASNQNGMIRFQTIFPGWYDPRAPHIHVKVYRGETAYLATQFYLPDGLCHRIYTAHPDYKAYGPSLYNSSNDMVFMMEPDGRGLLLDPKDAGPGLYAAARIVIPS